MIRYHHVVIMPAKLKDWCQKGKEKVFKSEINIFVLEI